MKKYKEIFERMIDFIDNYSDGINTIIFFTIFTLGPLMTFLNTPQSFNYDLFLKRYGIAIIFFIFSRFMIGKVYTLMDILCSAFLRFLSCIIIIVSLLMML